MREFGYCGKNTFIIDPTKKELKKLIRKGLFKDFAILEKMD